MKVPMQTQIGAGVFRDLAADDGWPEDAGLWPLEGVTPRSDPYWQETVDRAGQPALFPRLRSFLRSVTQIGSRPRASSSPLGTRKQS